MGDVGLYHTADGGEIDAVNGQFVMDDGLETAVYLSLFGGNERDSGLTDGEPLQWWANLDESDETRKYRSETQYLLKSIPAIPFNLRRIEDAIGRDLAWMLDTALATSVTAAASIPAHNTVFIALIIVIDGKTHTFEFTRDWGTTQ